MYNFKSNLPMLTFLGLKILQPITNRQKYRQALQQIKHYLSSKQQLQIEQNDYLLSLSHQQQSFSLVKNPLYLHTNYYSHPILKDQDYAFMEVCYQCLMIICETFPASVSLQIVSESESTQMDSFQQRKRQELSRRINGRLRAVSEQKQQLLPQEIEDIIFLIDSQYTRKNKLVALRLLINRISPNNCIDIPEQYLSLLQKLGSQPQMRKLSLELIQKIKAIQRQAQPNQNVMGYSNLQVGIQEEPIKLQSLIFQLKQSYSLQKICQLLQTALSTPQKHQYYLKLQSAVRKVSQKFVQGQYDQAHIFAAQFLQIVKLYWLRIGKTWDQNAKGAMQSRMRQFNTSNRVSGRSRMTSSRKQ